MSCLISFVFLVAMIIFLASLASKAQHRADRWNRAYQTLAQRYGGAFLPAGWFSRPSVRFQYASTQVLVHTHSSGRVGDFTQIHIHWPDPRFRLEIFSKWMDIAPRALRGMKDLTIGSPDFNAKYVIRGSDDDQVRAFLSDGVRWQIDRLRQLLNNQHIYLTIHRGRILIKKPTLIRRYEDLEEFTHLSLELYDQAMMTRSVGIEFVEGDQVQVIDEAICQICGEEITTDMVICRRCKTPHHQECWQYFGSCAIYGCGEKRYVTPKVAGPSGDLRSS